MEGSRGERSSGVDPRSVLVPVAVLLEHYKKAKEQRKTKASFVGNS